MTDKPEPIFKPGKGYETRGDKLEAVMFPARVYANDTGGVYPIHGAIYKDGEWIPHAWTNEGRSNIMVKTPSDLMPPKPKPREVWLWSWDNGGLGPDIYSIEEYATTAGRNQGKGHAVKFREVMDDE